jgi:hypothetical protein
MSPGYAEGRCLRAMRKAAVAGLKGLQANAAGLRAGQCRRTVGRPWRQASGRRSDPIAPRARQAVRRSQGSLAGSLGQGTCGFPARPAEACYPKLFAVKRSRRKSRPRSPSRRRPAARLSVSFLEAVSSSARPHDRGGTPGASGGSGPRVQVTGSCLAAPQTSVPAGASSRAATCRGPFAGQVNGCFTPAIVKALPGFQADPWPDHAHCLSASHEQHGPSRRGLLALRGTPGEAGQPFTGLMECRPPGNRESSGGPPCLRPEARASDAGKTVAGKVRDD